MKFSEFIVEMDEMPPSEPQKVDKPVSDDKPKIITPNKKLVLPAQPKREEPKGFKSEGPIKVDAFPNKIKHPYGVGGEKFDDDTHKRLKDFQISQYEEMAYNRDYEYQYDKNLEDIMKEYKKDTEDMTLEEMLEHDNFVHKHYVMGNELSDFLRYGDTRYRGKTSLEDYTKYWQAFSRVLTEEYSSEMAPKNLWRGLSWQAKDVFKDLKPGQIIHDPGFMSTATTPDGTASDFASGLMMHIKRGEEVFRPGIDMDAWGDNEQDEFVLHPNTALQFTGKEDDQNYHFNLLEPDFDDIDKYGKVWNKSIQNKKGRWVPAYEDPRDRERYKEMGFMESRQPLKLLNKMKDKMKEAFQQRMNDFHFEVLTPEEPEEKTEPKKFSKFTKQLDHDD